MKEYLWDPHLRKVKKEAGVAGAEELWYRTREGLTLTRVQELNEVIVQDDFELG